MSARFWHQIKFARTRLSALLFPRFLNPSWRLRAIEACPYFLFAFRAIQRYWIRDMFDAITAQLTDAGEKLAHLRRFL